MSKDNIVLSYLTPRESVMSQYLKWTEENLKKILSEDYKSSTMRSLLASVKEAINNKQYAKAYYLSMDMQVLSMELAGKQALRSIARIEAMDK